jgi:hypothetical protein
MGIRTYALTPREEYRVDNLSVNKVLRRNFGLTWKLQEMEDLIACSLHQIALGWSDQEWDERGM